MKTEEYFDWLKTENGGHCSHAKDLGDGIYAAIKPLLFHWTMIVGEIGDKLTIATRYCYADQGKALAALILWDGEKDPIGWHRHPDSGRRRPDGDPTQEYIEP